MFDGGILGRICDRVQLVLAESGATGLITKFSIHKALPIVVCASIVASCTTLPRAGPDDGVIAHNATTSLVAGDGAFSEYQYALVDISRDVLQHLFDPGPGSLYRTFGGGRGPAPEIRVGVGDVVQVTIFESSAGGLFIPAEAGVRPGNFVTFPEQEIDNGGSITVPYAGAIRAAGRTIPQIEAEIVNRLANRAIEPQATVAIVRRNATNATVLGTVEEPGSFDIRASGDRVLDMISRAKGLKYEDYESFVTLHRRGRSGTIYFNTLVEKSRENVFIAPGDTIYVYREQRKFLAFGASGLNGQFVFDSEKLTLGEGVAKAGGLLDNRADPAQVLLYRLEGRKTLEKMGVDLTDFDPEKKKIPTIYRTNFRNPASFFFAQKFPMRNEDVIYVSNADSVELIKFLDVLNTVSSTASGVSGDVVSTRDNIQNLARGGPRR